MRYIFILTAFTLINPSTCKSINVTEVLTEPTDENFDNNIIDFDEDYSVKYNKKHSVPWQANDISKKDAYKYTVVKNHNLSRNDKTPKHIIEETTPSESLGVIPLELLSTTDTLLSIIDSTTEPDLTVIPLSTTKKVVPTVEITQTVTLPSSTQQPESSTDSFYITTEHEDKVSTVSEKTETTTTKREVNNKSTEIEALNKEIEEKGRVKLEFESTSTTTDAAITTEFKFETKNNADNLTTIKTHLKTKIDTVTDTELNTTIDTTTNTNIKSKNVNTSTTLNVANVNENKDVSKVENGTQNEVLKTNTSKIDTNLDWDIDSKEITPFSGLDSEEQEVPEDYYDSKDVLPTTAPKNDALSVIFGLAGSVVESVVESVAERVVPKGIYDLFKRMQRQSEALEAERLRSREENGGLGQFGRGILKTISTGLSKPLSQLMAGVKDIGSLDSDRGFVSSLASGVTSVASAATSLADSFKDRVQAIYPGTVWCGDGHSAQARSSSELGLFFFTDTCCRQHDACKIYIRAGDTKYGLTNTGLFTRSHCSCDAKFRECLRKTNSLVSAQIGLTYFNVLGPQCFRKAHPIVRCVRKTRITGQKCEEYELDYTKPKMWQWFDNETF